MLECSRYWICFLALGKNRKKLMYFFIKVTKNLLYNIDYLVISIDTFLYFIIIQLFGIIDNTEMVA